MGDIESLLKATQVLTQNSHEKMTARQTLFFYAVAYHWLMGQSINMARMREIYPTLGRSIEKSISQFLEKTEQIPDALGWITQTTDPNDRRVRYLGLTAKGGEVLIAMIEAMRRA